MKSKLFKQTIRDDRTTAEGAAKRYYAEHPGTPSAMQQPRILVRGGRYVALLGKFDQRRSSLRSFDDLYSISRRAR